MVVTNRLQDCKKELGRDRKVNFPSPGVQGALLEAFFWLFMFSSSSSPHENETIGAFYYILYLIVKAGLQFPRAP